MVTKLNESLFDDLPNPVFKDRYNDGLEWYRIDYEYSPEYGKSYERETWVRAKNIKDAEQKFFEKHNDDCYISEIMDKETALGIDYEMEDISRSLNNKYSNLTESIEESSLELAQMSFETGHYLDREDFDRDEDYEEYIEYMDLGPSGFYEEYKDELDFDPDFASEYGDNEDFSDYLDESDLSIINEDDTLKNYAIELETGEIKVIKAKSMDDAADKVMNEYNIPLWAFGVCGIVDDDFAASCGKFESVDIEDELKGCHYDRKEENMVIKEVYDDSLYVDIDEVIGTIGRALEEGTRDPDVFAELADVYGRLVEMRDAGYQLNTVQDESLKENRLSEGNPVSHELPSLIDSFLQDVAQTTGQISYNDIAKFAKSKFTSEDLKALRKLRRAYYDDTNWEDDDDDLVLNDIGKKVATIVKKKVNEELIDESVDASSLERYVNGQALPSYGEDVIYDNIDASEACDAVEYMYGLKSKREALNMIHSGEVSKEEILKAIAYYNLKDLPQSVRSNLFCKEPLD